MPKQAEVFALADYTPPERPTPLGKLTTAQKNKIKTIIRERLANGPGSFLVLGTETMHDARTKQSLHITRAHVALVLEEMREAGEFAEGYGAKSVVVEPAPEPK